MLIPMDVLFKKYKVRPTGTLHCGANIGEEAEAYDKAGIKKVIWIEANPDIFTKLQANISKYPGHSAFNYCIGDETGRQVTFHVSNNGGQSSSFLDLGTHAKSHPDVHYIQDITMQTTRIDSMGLDLSGVDFLAADLQGTELLALKGMGDLLNQFKYAYLEINKQELYKGCALWPEVEAYMKGFGFVTKEIKMSGNTGWGDCLMIKR